MLQKKVACAVLGALGMFGLSMASAAPGNVRMGAMGHVNDRGLAQGIGLSADASLMPAQSARTAHGTLKTREHQMFRGVPV
jgi:vibriolysin